MGKTNISPAELIDRYIYDVTRRLKPGQRADIEKELRTLIDDMLADRSGAKDATVEVAEEVLKELGRPAVLASKYREGERYLIGPQNFEIYILVLKIVLVAAAFGLSLALVIGYIVKPPSSVIETFAHYTASIISALVQAFAWVTVIFALMERYGSKEAFHKGWEWNPGDLPPVPHQKAEIKKGEPIVGLVFSVILLVIINAAPWLFGVWFFDGRTVSIPLFDLQVWNKMLPLLNALACLGILKEVLRLISGRYTIKLAAAITIINILSLIAFISVFGSPNIWNPSFLSSVSGITGISWASGAQAAAIWAAVPKVLMGIAVFGHTVDTISVIYKAARYSAA